MRISDWSSDVCSSDLLCCNTGGFGVYAAVRGAGEVVGVDIDQDVLDIARGNAKLNDVRVRFVQADIFPWLRDAAAGGDAYDVVILDPAKMTRDREQVIPALKKYLDMNRAEEHTSELQSLMRTSYAAFCFKKKNE